MNSVEKSTKATIEFVNFLTTMLDNLQPKDDLTVSETLKTRIDNSD